MASIREAAATRKIKDDEAADIEESSGDKNQPTS